MNVRSYFSLDSYPANVYGKCMRILVCIKPDVTGEEIGPFEILALEAGLCLKESCIAVDGQACQVDVIIVGPDHWMDCIHRALGMGADSGIHILTAPQEDGGGLIPASVVAGLLAAFAASSEHPYDLILTGVMSQDLMAGQTGPMLAEYLDIACATAVVQAECRDNILAAQREWEGGYRETLDLELPALISVQSGFYTPRYPTLSHMLKAKTKPITVLNRVDLEAKCKSDLLPELTPRECFSGLEAPTQTREGKIIQGSLQEQVLAFNTFLQQRALI